MQGIIIYKSNYGATEQYAQWLNEATGYPVFEMKKVSKQDILQAEVVILYTTSGTLPEDPVLRQGFEASFKPEIIDKVHYFPQGGRMIFAKLSPLHKFFMNLGKKMEKNPQIREAMGKDKDNLDRNGIKPILKYVS